jgi:hypothetical protein
MNSACLARSHDTKTSSAEIIGMINNNSEFLLNTPTLKLVIYSSMIVGNILFVSLHPMHIQVDVIAALYFLLG